MNLEVQVLWQGQRFVNLDLEVQISWQAHRVGEPRSAEFVSCCCGCGGGIVVVVVVAAVVVVVLVVVVVWLQSCGGCGCAHWSGSR